MSDRKKGQEEHPERQKPPEKQRPAAPPEDPVDEASWESFPASDPPSFTPGKGT